ncbi:MAG: hypothetical protein DHS20C05_23720 [Hyphococcus sp.]|nr:MAG: hypothetical protein DHS20C05_23720 [Marinicaulis sp.]
MRFAVLLLVFVGILGAGIFGALRSFNHFSEIPRSFAGQCTPVTGIAGPEDILITPGAKRVFISSRDRRQPDQRGSIHIFDLADPLAGGGWQDMTSGMPEEFNPLGIDYFEDGDVRRLFVVNEVNAAIEVFEVAEDGALIHLETFAERRLTSPNNVVAVGPRSFYVTNDVKQGRDTQIGKLHFLTRQASGQVLYYNGVAWQMAAEGLKFANGIVLSQDQKRLYVAETAGRAIRVYDRDLETGALFMSSGSGRITLPTAPDNLSIDESGALWAATLPKPLAVPLHGANPDVIAPSQIIRVTPGGDPQIIYSDDGKELSASTTAARFGQTLLIGALYDEKFLICDLPAGSI